MSSSDKKFLEILKKQYEHSQKRSFSETLPEIETTTAQIKGLTFRYLFAYFPRCYPYNKQYHKNEETEKSAKFINFFRTGVWPELTAELLSSELKKIYTTKELSELYFCVIPSGNDTTTRIMFEQFCQKICTLTKMKNGFDVIKLKPGYDKIISRHRDRPNNIDHIAFYSEKINNKRILLFDAVITTGHIFESIAASLLDQGAVLVDGFFFGRTFSKIKDNSELENQQTMISDLPANVRDHISCGDNILWYDDDIQKREDHEDPFPDHPGWWLGILD